MLHVGKNYINICNSVEITPLDWSDWDFVKGYFGPITIFWEDFDDDGFVKEIFYAIKSFVSVKSGYVGMEMKKFRNCLGEFDWEPCKPGDDYPYYVCAKFSNGRHIPLPILGNRSPANRLQKLAIRLAGGCPEAQEDIEAHYEYWK